MRGIGRSLFPNDGDGGTVRTGGADMQEHTGLAGFGLGTVEVRDRGIVAALVRDEQVVVLADHQDHLKLTNAVTVRGLLEDWDRVLPELHALADAPDVEPLLLADVRILAPLEPCQVIQSGANYRTHVIDLHVAHAKTADDRPVDEARAEAEAQMDQRAAEGTPYLFVGLPSAISGPYDDVVLPDGGDQHDWELELAAVIGRPAYRVKRHEALDHVAGYTIANDLTTRDLVFRPDMPAIGTDWFRSKNAPGFTPLGPWVVPSAFVGDPMDLQITLRLNGQVMQNESTADMIFDVATLVSAASQTVRLLPGDLVLTGSPAGNGMAHGRLLRDGDVMEGTITGLGVQRTHVAAEEATR
jgi:2-keto-4-pentenoate hydratase/2-oxohepta-3-ene-1,7-dioic acid hydratase in catechol pathway